MPKTEMETTIRAYPLLPAEDRLSVWEKVRGIWKNRTTDPIEELKKIRKEWNRRLPKIKQ